MEENENIITEVSVVEEDQGTEVIEVAQIVEVEEAEAIVIEVDEVAVSLEDGGHQFNHALLNNRELPNQHPIIAIEGLRQELDNIEALQTIYSDKTQQADYYLWYQNEAAGYTIPSNPYNLFVSIHTDTDQIQICNGTNDVFGVTVSEAAFVGNQEYAQAEGGVKTGRDGNYTLVTYSGLVYVRCETTVNVGDYVVPNTRGEAKKSNGDYGYLVTKISEDGKQALISLSQPFTLNKRMADNVEDLGERMETAEYNIVSVGNVANSAYTMALDAKENAEINEEYLKEQIEDVLGRMDAVDDVVGNLSSSITNASAAAAMAQAIAEGAASSANAIKDEAITATNNALAEMSNTKKDLEAQISEANNRLNEAVEDLEDELEPLATWTNDDGYIGIAGFVARANEDAATLKSMTKFDGQYGKALAGFIQEAATGNATVKAIASYQVKDADGNLTGEAGVTTLLGQVDANKASIDALAKLEGEGFTGLAGLMGQVNQNKSSVQTLASHVVGEFEYVDVWDAEGKDQNKVYYNKNDKKYYYYDKENTEWKSTAKPNEAGLKSAIASVQQQADTNSAKIDSFVDWQGTTNNAISNIKQQADANGASIEMFVSNIDKYAVGEYSQAYGLTLKQAEDILSNGTVYIPTIKHTEKYSGYKYIDEKTKEEITVEDYELEFVHGYAYTWTGASWTPSNSTTVSFSSEYVDGSETTPYWVVTTQNVTRDDTTYELGNLYKWEQINKVYQWVKVASIAGNSFSRAASVIKQTQNSIETSITTLDGKYVGTKDWIDTNKSAIQQAVKWTGDNADSITTFMQEAGDNFASASQVAQIVDKEGNVKSASIVTAVIDDESFISGIADRITLDASKINMTGTDQISMAIKDSIDNMEIGGRNLVRESMIVHNAAQTEDKEYQEDGSIRWHLKRNDSETTKGSYIDHTIFKKGETYAISYCFKKTGGKLETIGGHCNAFKVKEAYLDNVKITQTSYSTGFAVDNNNEDHYVVLIVEYNNTSTDNNLNFYIQPNREISTAIEYDLWNIKVEKGNKATEWTPAPEDMTRNNNIITSINLSEEGVKITGDLIEFEGSKFKSTMYDKIDSIQIGGRNLAYKNSIKASSGVTNFKDLSNDTTKNPKKKGYYWEATSGESDGIYLDQQLFEANKTYTLSYYFKKITGDLQNIGGHMLAEIYEITNVIIDNKNIPVETYTGSGNAYYFSADNLDGIHHVVITFKTIETPNVNNANHRLYIQPNRAQSAITYHIWDIQVEKGNKATDWTPAPEDVDKKLDECYSTIEQTAEQIGLTVNEKTEALDDQIKDLQASIKVTSESITSTVSEAVDNLQIGGRNLLKGTNTAQGWSVYDEFKVDTHTFIKHNNSTSEKVFWCDNHFDLEKDQQYTISFKAKSEIEATNCFEVFILHSDSYSYILDKQITLTTDYKDYSYTFTPTISRQYRLRFDNNGKPNANSNQQTIYVKEVKLEKGNKATDWTPAPEDIDAQFAKTSEKISEIEQTAGSITTTVAEAVNNIQVGSRNLIQLNQLKAINCKIEAENTNEVKVTNIAVDNLSIIILNDEDEYAPGEYMLNAIRNGNSQETFDLAFSYKYDDTCLEDRDAYGQTGCPYIKENVKLPYKLNLKQQTKLGLRIRSSVGPHTITGLKLEKGNKATDWSPAPEDIYTKMSQIKQTADSITLSVSNMQIGGRNLIPLSKLIAIDCDIQAENTNNIAVANVLTGNTSILKFDTTYAPGEYVLNATGSKSGKSFRLLFDCNYNDLCTHNAWYANQGYPYFTTNNVTLPIKLTFTQDTKIGMVMLTSDGNQTITGLQLEKGNVATDWSPAPEDAEDRLSKAEASIKINSESIASKVSNNQTGENCSWNMTADKFEVLAGSDGAQGGITVDSGGLTVRGKVEADRGKIGGFEITTTGFVNPQRLSITSESAFFKTATFNLNNDVLIYNDDILGSDNRHTSYIATTGDRHFEIKNNGGAGIRFAANKVNQETSQTITLNNFRIENRPGTGIYDDFYHIYFLYDYSISNSSVLADPFNTTFYLVTAIRKCNLLGVWQDKGSQMYAISVTIPKLSGSGTIEYRLNPDEFGLKLENRTFMGVSYDDSDYGLNNLITSRLSYTRPLLDATNNILYSLGSFCPNLSADQGGTMSLGHGNGGIWNSVVSQNCVQIVSDRNQKHDIKYLSTEFETFYDNLKPVSFKYNYNESNRTHMGFIAQDIEESLHEANIDTKDFAGICISYDPETNNKKYFLRYEEFIPLNTLEIQKLKKRVEELEEKLNKLQTQQND